MDAVTKNMRGEAVVGYGWLHAVRRPAALRRAALLGGAIRRRLMTTPRI
jgi:hypothetical protein